MTGETTADTAHRIIIAGFGGQGILTLGKLLGMAGIAEGRDVTYLPSYGAEVRGGTANCQVIISPGAIYSPLVERANTLIMLNEPSYDKFLGRLEPGGLLVVNASGVDMDRVARPDDAWLLPLPAAEAAIEMGNVRVANVLMLGAFVACTGVVSAGSCAEAIKELLGRRKAELLDLNLRALARGAELAGAAQTGHQERGKQGAE